LGRVHATKQQYNIKKKGTKTRHSVSLVVGGLFFVWFCVECQNFLSLPKFGKRSMIIPNRKTYKKKSQKVKTPKKKAVKEENNHFLSLFSRNYIRDQKVKRKRVKKRNPRVLLMTIVS